jgi:hypothetical protein
MIDQSPLPDFESPHTDTEPAPRKPRPKPMKKRSSKAVNTKKLTKLVPKRQPRKRRRVRLLPDTKPARSEPINAALFTACLSISNILTPFSKGDRKAVLKAIGDMVEAAP